MCICVRVLHVMCALNAVGPGSPLSQLSYGLLAWHAPSHLQIPSQLCEAQSHGFFTKYMCYTWQHTHTLGRSHGHTTTYPMQANCSLNQTFQHMRYERLAKYNSTSLLIWFKGLTVIQWFKPGSLYFMVILVCCHFNWVLKVCFKSVGRHSPFKVAKGLWPPRTKKL